MVAAGLSFAGYDFKFEAAMRHGGKRIVALHATRPRAGGHAVSAPDAA